MPLVEDDGSSAMAGEPGIAAPSGNRKRVNSVKKILSIQDLSGLGRAALVPVIGVLCAMGHQCVPLPTAAYSSHHGLAGWQGCDLTGLMRPAVTQYQSLGIRFDAVAAGFLSCAEQIEIVAEAAQLLGAGLLVVDPVMGDNGRLYSSVTPALCEKMAWLCGQADVITPNSTEAAVLLGQEGMPRDEGEAQDWAFRLWERFGTSVVLTGLPLHEGQLTLACCGGEQVSLLHHARIGAYYPGTGDIFAAVLTGGLVSGESVVQAAQRAAGFVRECIAATEQSQADRLQGVQFERQLWRLWETPRRE